MFKQLTALYCLVLASTTFADTHSRIITQTIDSKEQILIDIRRDIHMHPELSFQEERTAALVADHLNGLGLDVRTGVGGHGVVGIKHGPVGAPVVAYRADMDAVPSAIIGDQPYRSTVPGVKHVCGHDLHTAVGIGVAEALIATDIPATWVFVFQPAEERIAGARAMIDAGAFDVVKPDAFFAVHTAPFPVGSMLLTPGGGLAGFQPLQVSWPSGDDDMATAGKVRVALLSANTLPPFNPESTAGTGLLDDFIAVYAAPSFTVEDGQTILGAQFNFPSEEKLHTARDLIRKAVTDAVPAASVSFVEQYLPPMLSNEALTENAAPVVRSQLGEDQTMIDTGVIPYFGEDFIYFSEIGPAAMFLLGVANPEKGIMALNHTPDYDVDEDAIAIGAKTMAHVMADFAIRHQGSGG